MANNNEPAVFLGSTAPGEASKEFSNSLRYFFLSDLILFLTLFWGEGGKEEELFTQNSKPLLSLLKIGGETRLWANVAHVELEL